MEAWKHNAQNVKLQKLCNLMALVKLTVEMMGSSIHHQMHVKVVIQHTVINVREVRITIVLIVRVISI